MIYFNQIESPERGYGAASKALEEFEKLKKMYPRNPYKELIELRIDKCKTTMADYEFLVGEYYFKKGSFKAALGRFQSLRTKYPDYRKEPLVLYHIALSQKNIGNKDKAIEYLNLLIEKYPNDQLVKEARKMLAALSK
jgi:outer membrane protein assembly factor BamD